MCTFVSSDSEDLGLQLFSKTFSLVKDKWCRVIEKDGVAWEGGMTIGRIAKEVRELYTFINLQSSIPLCNVCSQLN